MSTRIDIVTRADLHAMAIAAESDPARFPVVPIEPLRAQAQSRNPVSATGDPTLLVAYKDDRCVGYLGLLPQVLRRGQTTIKALAFSALYLEPALRGSGLAQRLLESARGLGFPLLTIGNSRAAQAFFIKSGMQKLAPYRIVQLRLGPGAAIAQHYERSLRLLRRIGAHKLQPAARGLKQLSLAAAGPFRQFGNRRAYRAMASNSELLAFGVPAFRNGVATPIDERKLRVHWDADALNWMLDCPWIGAQAAPPAVASRYHFNASDPGFRHAACELIDAKGQLAGFAAFLVHRHHAQKMVSLLQYSTTDAAGNALILRHAFDLARESNADIVRCGEEWIMPLEEAGLGKHLVVTERQSFVDAPMHAEEFADYAEGFADGDIAFY
jgi:GNAT superfamily N-acetyltransferase